MIPYFYGTQTINAMLTIYHNPRCRKSRETLELIRESDNLVEIVEYLEDQLSAEELEELLEKLGMKAEQLVRKQEAVYKENYKGKQLSEQEWIAAMVEHPKLIERPIVVREDRAVLGRPPENVKVLF
jgi:arsenate reductase